MEKDKSNNAADEFVTSEDSVQKKCPSCGGRMVYSPGNEKLKCEYCGATVDLDLSAAEIKENDFEYWSQHPDQMAQIESLKANVKCKHCGASTTFPPDVSSFSCAFCGSPIVLSESVQKRSWSPEYILPFKIESKNCDAQFQKWIKSRWFLPSKMKKGVAASERFKGVYLPYWTYDAETHSNYTGQKGVDHTERTKDSNGNTETHTVTDWYRVNGSVSRDFDDVLVPASNSLPKKLSSVLLNWDRQNYVVYNEAFVRGFITELYQSDFKECYKEAVQIMDQKIREDVKHDIGGDHQRITSLDTDFSNIKFKHVLLPVWISAFKYKNKSYIFAINGRNGTVVGERPYSAMKITLFIIAIIAVIVLLANYLQ